MLTHKIYNCELCKVGKSGFKFCSGNCDAPKDDILEMELEKDIPPYMIEDKKKSKSIKK